MIKENELVVADLIAKLYNAPIGSDAASAIIGQLSELYCSAESDGPSPEYVGRKSDEPKSRRRDCINRDSCQTEAKCSTPMIRKLKASSCEEGPAKQAPIPAHMCELEHNLAETSQLLRILQDRLQDISENTPGDGDCKGTALGSGHYVTRLSGMILASQVNNATLREIIQRLQC